ncbi:hypothetical protein QQ008_15660 [Fulvivirgaceae bacterium BMA10]|uniref:Uncharacterized protein n=1 Tax=Splendidivirga corallicola TaxID=3051826 RepID=A0ABT8KQ27_9BACT|nr:hypothetical protein [Fulvivirgaceae bacterium BMA10]
MRKKSITYDKLGSIRLLELVKNLDSIDPQFFYVNREPELEIELDFDIRSVNEFLEFTDKHIYERLFIFECNKEDIDNLENFLFLCLVLENTHHDQEDYQEKTFKGFNDLTFLNKEEFLEEVSLYVNDHFFEELYDINIETSSFMSAYKVFKDEFFYVFESHSLFRAYHWERYI